MTLNFYTNPGTAPATNGWFWAVPEVWIEDDAVTTAAYYKTLGTSANHSAYIGSTYAVLSAEASEVFTEAELSGHPNVAMIAYATYGGTEYPLVVKHTNQEPSYTSFVVKDVQGNTVSSTYIPMKGSFNITGINPGTGFSTQRISIYTDGKESIKLTGGPTTFTASYLLRSPVTTASISIASSAVSIPFAATDILKDSSSLYASLQNSAEVSVRTDVRTVRPEYYPPSIDRLSVAEDEPNSSIMGNVVSDAPVAGIEYTTDRRVPGLHVKLSGNAYTVDNEAPVASSVSSYTTGPFSTTSGAAVFSNTYADYSNTCMNLYEGTIEFWFKPSSVSNTFCLFDFYKTTPNGALTKDRIFIEGTSSNVIGKVYDSFGNLSSAVATISMSTSYWYHITMKYLLNKSKESKIYVQCRGNSTLASGASTGLTVPFGLLASKDMQSQLDDEVPNTSVYYSNVRIGQSLSGTSAAAGAYADFRVSDCYTNEDHSLDSGYSGWTTSGASGVVQFNTDTKMFWLTGIPSASATVYTYRLRPYTNNGERKKSSLFNSPSNKPILIRGTWGGLVDPDVERFRLIDATGYFPDYTFVVNPSTFNIQESDSEIVKKVSSINGKRILSTSKLPATSLEMSWENCNRAHMLDIEKRGVKGTSFFLIDHNDEVYFGKINISSIEEIVAKNPSRYRVTISFVGQGGRDDYRMG